MVSLKTGFFRDGRNSYRRVDVPVTDDRYLQPRPVDSAETLKIADRYAAGRLRNN